MVKPDQLPYDFSALEPYIDKETMHLHYEKHYQAYLDKLNEALMGHEDLSSKDIKNLLMDLEQVPEEIRTKVQNNGGGYANHSMFWKIMGPFGSAQGTPAGKLRKAIDGTFGGLESFKDKFTEVALNRFGSGWAWMTIDSGKLSLESTQNQDTPLMEGKKAILCLDVWEHAYYLKYQNRRTDYIKAWWNVVNWEKVEEYFSKASK